MSQRRFLLATALAVGAAGAVHGQTLEAVRPLAEKDGALVWYAAMRSEHIELIAGQFRKAFPGIKLETIYLTSGEIAARVIMEQRGRRFNADVLSGPSAAISQLKLEGKLAPFLLPKDLAAQHAEGASDPDGFWAVQYMLSYPITYNTQAVAALGLGAPRTYEDLTQPKWAGKFAISQVYYDWYQGLADYYGRVKAKDLAQRLAANKPLIRGTSSAVLQLLTAGEYAATFHTYGYATEEEKQKGQPVDYTNAEPVVATMQTGAIALNAPHPNAAKLFQIWLASKDMQQFMVTELGRISTHKEAVNNAALWNPSRDKVVLLNPDRQVNTSKEFQEEYRAIFGIGSSRAR